MNTIIRTNEIMNKLSGCSKKFYRRDEILPELMKLQNEIVSLTFNMSCGEESTLRLWDVENHLDRLNQENGFVAADELKAFKSDCKDFVNYIKGIISGYKGENWTFRKLEGLKVANRIIKNVPLSNQLYRTELDAVVLTHKGAFIVEIKNTKRDVFIDEKGQYYRTGEFLQWDSDIGYKSRVKAHLLIEKLYEAGNKIPVTTVVLFSNNKIKVQNKYDELKTCFIDQLSYLIEDFDSDDVLTDEDMDSIAEMLGSIVGRDSFPMNTDTEKLKRDFAAVMVKLETANELAATADMAVVEGNRQPGKLWKEETTGRRHPVLEWFSRIMRNRSSAAA